MEPTDDTHSHPLRRSTDRSRNNDSRYFRVDDEGWYLRTREGTQGPFETRSEAETFLSDLIRAQTGRNPLTVY